MTRWFVSPTGNDTTGAGTMTLPYRTIQKALVGCATSDEIIVEAGNLGSQNLNLSLMSADSVRITANPYAVVTIRTIRVGSAVLMIQGGEWFWGNPAAPAVSPFAPAARSFLFDNAVVHIERTNTTPQVFYHCDVVVNSAFVRHMFLSCKLLFMQDVYWYKQSAFYYYFCRMSAPEGMDDVPVPIYDQIGFSDLLGDIVRREYLMPRNSKPSFLSRTLSQENLYVPWNSLNGPTVKEGPNLAAMDSTNTNYIDNDWAFLLGADLLVFRANLSLSANNGNAVAGAVEWTPTSPKRFGEYVYPTSTTGSNGKGYKCVVAGTTDATEPTWPITEGNVVVDGSATWQCVNESEVPVGTNLNVFQTPNFFERYIKNLFSETYILNEKLLYYQGILNSQYIAEGFANLYEMYGIDVKSIAAYNLSTMWSVAGSVVGLMNMLECDACTTGVSEFNKKRNFPIGRIPFYYDTAAEQFVFHRRVTSTWTGTARNQWPANTAIRIGTILYITGPGGTLYEFECTGEGTTGAVAPTWSFVDLAYVTDNTVTWRCFGLVASAVSVGRRQLYAAYDYIRHYFDYDYTMEIQRQTTEQSITPLLGWNYIYFNHNTENYAIGVPSLGSSIASLFDQYIGDLRSKEHEPIAFALIEKPGAVLVVKEVIMLQGGLIGYNSAIIGSPTEFVVWPNNVFSYASISRGGQATTDKNTDRDDAILKNIFKHTFALDTELYRQAPVKEWGEYAGAAASVGDLVQPTNGAHAAEVYVHQCTVAGTCDIIEPLVWNTTPGGTTTDGGVTWTNLGYFKMDWRQIENP